MKVFASFTQIHHILDILPYLDFLFVFCFLWGGLGFELRASSLQSRHCTAQAMPPVHFALFILEKGSCELFAMSGLKPQTSNLSLPSS
jgi:hypothetical protein